VDARLLASGFSAEDVAGFAAVRRVACVADLAALPLTEAADGEDLTLVGLRVRVIATPGHTVGHAGLLLPDQGVAFTGDHVLFDLVPAVFTEVEDFDLLGAYLDGLQRMADLGARLFLPSHRRPRTAAEFAARTAVLWRHHHRRLDGLAALVAARPGITAAEAVAAVSADAPGPDWAELAVGRRWSIATTALARLHHLAVVGRIDATTGPDGLTHYRATP
jgi:glyoxylase-like metal-dependent hydrolase (beta-lactamase superfamily II)